MLRKLVDWLMALRGFRPFDGTIVIKADGKRRSGTIEWDVFGRQWHKELEAR